MFRVELGDESIHLMKDGEEVAMWDQSEWTENPSLVLNIVNAISIGYTRGGGAILAILESGIKEGGSGHKHA